MMRTQFKHKGKFIFFPIIALAFILGAAYVVMLLWNGILSQVVTAVTPVTFVQALGLLVLSRILFGGFGGRGHYRRKNGRCNSRWNDKLTGMSDEEREFLRNEWRARCSANSPGEQEKKENLDNNR